MKNAVVSIVIFTAFISGCDRSAQIIGLNENIHHDDFIYRVTAVEKRKSIVSDSVRMIAGGMFYIITFEVENDAKRVSHIWDNRIAYVITGKGDRYENNMSAQRLLETKEPFGWHSTYNTGHGSIEQTRLVFDVAGNPGELYLKVNGVTLMGDIFDLNRFKRIKIKLL
jgi:hypothetical protein